jgi:hypothetical protein
MPRLLKRSISSDDASRVIWSCSWIMDDGLKWRVERLDGSVRLRLVYEHNFIPENCSGSYGKTLFDIFDVYLFSLSSRPSSGDVFVCPGSLSTMSQQPGP